MYIWILLASIMVALSFFNVTPRADKDNAVSEIRTSIIVQRFKAEHLALTKTLECEMIYNNASYSSPTSINTNFDVGYTSFRKNLPVGYDLNVGGITIYHKLVCMTLQIVDENARVQPSCAGSPGRYAISFAQIPDRWITKDAGNTVPLPALVNFLAKEKRIGDNYGWVKCNVGECMLVGKNAAQTVPETIPANSPIWSDSQFANLCRTGKPCLFAYKKLTLADNGNQCQKAMQHH